MKVTLLDYTGSGQPNPAHYAAAILAFTKNTRLNMTAGSLFEWIVKPWEELEAELRYMANTIPSSWEFVDYTFQIEGVTRAFTHQLVRTRTASYAQQTMRVLDVSEGPGWDFLTGPSLLANPVAKEKYELAMAEIADVYKELTRGAGVKTEDARGILPTNILTNITVKMNMRTFVEMVRKRSSSRTQGEYRDVLDALKNAVKTVHPWIEFFIERDADKAITDLEFILNNSGLRLDERTRAIKLLDQLRALV
jgi:thymidylate synthase (FAD)